MTGTLLRALHLNSIELFMAIMTIKTLVIISLKYSSIDESNYRQILFRIKKKKKACLCLRLAASTLECSNRFSLT